MNRFFFKQITPIRISYYTYRYFAHKINLTRAKFRDWQDSRVPGNVPVPPAHLRHRVHGRLDKESFLRTGAILAQNIRDLCTLVGRDIYSFENILDFGCGSGRVLRNFQDALDSCHLYGTDIDAELIGWCKGNLPRVQWNQNGYEPPLPYADDTFDLIYAISVFSHLDEQFQHSWLRELRRVAKPGASVILSVHGRLSIKSLDPSLQQQVYSQGFMYMTGAKGILKLDKLPDFYQTAFHTEEYIRRVWSEYFDVVRYKESFINGHQDAAILCKS